MSQEEALNWIAKVLEEEPGGIQPDSPREDIPTWDSIGQLNLMAEMDEQFGIMLSEEQLQNMNRVSDILELLRKHEKMAA